MRLPTNLLNHERSNLTANSLNLDKQATLCFDYLNTFRHAFHIPATRWVSGFHSLLCQGPLSYWVSSAIASSNSIRCNTVATPLISSSKESPSIQPLRSLNLKPR